MRGKLLLLLMALPLAASAEDYTLGSPLPANVTNGVFVATAGYVNTAAISSVDSSQMSEVKYTLASAEAGFTWERLKPDYYLSDQLDAPTDVDWTATKALYDDLPDEQKTFLFNTDRTNPGVYAVTGGNRTFRWVLTDGTTNEVTYTIAVNCSGRPRRIFWTDSPYNGPSVSLEGKFVKFMGNDELLTLQYGTKVTRSGGTETTNNHAIVRGLYIDESAHVLYAAGELSGQCVMVYYDSGSYTNILAVQVVEVRRPEVIPLKGTIGEPLKASGQGYATDGLVARVTAGIGDSDDDRGDYLYQHAGSYSYSPKNKYVFPLRPTVGKRWKAEVYWMETDAMGVSWPFELDQYESDWPDAEDNLYVRGTTDGDYGAKIYIPTDYTATLQSYQEPEGHAVAVSSDNAFYTKGAGWSLLKLTANDNVWFMPIRSVLRTDTDYFTLESARVTIGHELTLRSGPVSGVASNAFLTADADIPGTIYKPASGTGYDVNLYHPTTNATSATSTTTASTSSDTLSTLPSKVFAIAETKPIEVWWSRRYQPDDLPYAISVPTLPQVYELKWPETDEMPPIVIASQQGSANKTVYQQKGAATFATDQAGLELADRRYFPNGAGTISFWTRPAVYDDDVLAVTNAPTELVNIGNRTLSIAIDDEEILVVYDAAKTVLASVEMPALAEVNDWTHIAVAFDATTLALYVNGTLAAETTGDFAALAGYLTGNFIGLNAEDDDSTVVAAGRQIAELALYQVKKDEATIKAEMHLARTGEEANLTGYYAFESGRDLASYFQAQALSVSAAYERLFNEACVAINVILTEPGAPLTGTGVIAADESPKIYYQNDSTLAGYNPNEEHAYIASGSGGYVAWALRSDLNTATSSKPAVFVEYAANDAAHLQMFTVLLTNETWTTLGATCTAGYALPGPHPLDTFESPWLAEDYWDAGTGSAVGPAYRDRKGQLWARAAGTLPIYMYYRQQEGFWYPSLSAAKQPATGTAIPWLALVDHPNGNPLTDQPEPWTWTIVWPDDAPEMKIGQTLTVAAGGLPEVWSAKSMAVIYPDPDTAEETVMLSDPTVLQSVLFDYANLAKLGLSTDKNGGLTLKGGKYHFTELPPHLSSRFYVDATNQKMCFLGERKTTGTPILYPNVISDTERQLIHDLVAFDMKSSQPDAYAQWEIAVAALATAPVIPNTSAWTGNELLTTYKPVDHYALTAMGATNYVTLIENDATNKTQGVAESDSINMHVLKVIPEYYTGRVVVREDEINLLSQQLSILYAEPFGGKADDFIFEWRKASPNANGTVPTAYDDTQVYKTRAGYDDATEPRFVIGGQGDTLDNMVNTYWICRYKARTNSVPAYATMGEAWSAWCAPPALAEGWVQRVLNNVTPFNQRMTDLYNNTAETTVSMISEAGAPYEGDVALNQDNLTSVGLIQLYETIFSKAESMSLKLGLDNTDANKQLLLCAERLDDLYALLGDEAYSDAKNPTIGFGSNMANVENQPNVDFGAASSGLFCFDNQVSSLLDEELALLRGRTGDSAPVTTLSPCYNRLLWNFTKGITAGEVAYAVNYNIEGTETTALSEEQAKALYPQGHGDAYGHYLSALHGWYRLLRNEYFTWPRAQGEMTVNDETVNVDYYEEAKFASAAQKLAKTAADVVDLTARASWRDNEGSMDADYEDADTNRAFGVGEWANRGAYGALCNWVVANSLLPAHEDGAELQRIDRGTVDELPELCTYAANIQAAQDRIDAEMNPLGLADTAIPFDITPIGVSDGSSTHYEQIRARTGTALKNARATLDKAQEYANRLRMIQESADSYKESVKEQEAAYTKELIGYYGTPYSDDIGPGKTYAQGYDGPDLVHYMWMDLAKFGLTEVADTKSVTLHYYTGLTGIRKWYTVFTALGDKLNDAMDNCETNTTIVFETSANGLVVKPSTITGSRVTQGSIQEKYADFLTAYAEYQNLKRTYDGAVTKLDVELAYCGMMSRLYFSIATVKQAVAIYKQYASYKEAGVNMALNALDYYETLAEGAQTAIDMAVPSTVGAGMTVITSPRSFAEAATSVSSKALGSSTAGSKMTLKNSLITSSIGGIALTYLEDELGYWVSYYENIQSIITSLQEKASAVTAAYNDVQAAIIKVNTCVDAYNAEVAKGETCLAEREAARKKQVNAIAQFRYNDMFFRLLRNQALSRYTASFDLAQKYAFFAAQAYDYETAQLSGTEGSGDAFKAEIIGSRSLGSFTDDGDPLVGDVGDTGLAGLLAQMDANYLVLKPRLGINNPQDYATWFSLRSECFRILDGEEGNAAWAKELTKYWVDDITSDATFRRYCQPFQSQYGLKDKEPGLIIPFSTTIDFAKNLFGNDLAGGDHAYDSTWYATRIAAAGLWFDGYNGKTNGYTGKVQLSATPVAYLVPVGTDCLRVPGLDENSVLGFNVTDQVIPAPYAIDSPQLDDDSWYPTASEGDWGGADSAAKIRRHPSFRAYFDTAGGEPKDDCLDATRLVGRSVWNTKWLLVIPAGGLNADRDKALSIFINGSDQNRDGKQDLTPVSDIKIGFKTYSTSGN